jgi:hypothetical protein
MTETELNTLISKVAKTENTPELASYWKDRYASLLTKGKFEINIKTYEFLVEDQAQPIAKPVTPFGDVVISKHLTSQQDLDKVSLQTTIETSVRFLDSCLEAINFTPEARHLISQYRKIGVGIKNYQEYLENQKQEAEIGNIDILGEVMSSVAYRASEALAFEKGPCGNWSKISQHLRPKAFEFWKDESSNDLKTGLELVQDFDQDSIKQTAYQILPRRNSHILLFPEDLEWQLWGDRDQTSPQTPLDPYQQSAPETELTPFTPENLVDKKLAQTESPTVTTQTPIVERLEEMLSQKPEAVEVVKKPNTKDLQDSENVTDKALDSHTNETSKTNPNPTFEEFEIGELVKVVDSKNPHFGKVFQVINGVTGVDMQPHRYNLYGDGVSEGQFWSHEQLQSIELDQILEILNKPQEPSKVDTQDSSDELQAKFEKTLEQQLSLQKQNLQKQAQQDLQTQKQDLEATYQARLTEQEKTLRSALQKEYEKDLQRALQAKDAEVLKSQPKVDMDTLKRELEGDIKKTYDQKLEAEKSRLKQEQDKLVSQEVAKRLDFAKEEAAKKALEQIPTPKPEIRTVTKEVKVEPSLSEILSRSDVQQAIADEAQKRVESSKSQATATSSINLLKMMQKHEQGK